MIIAFFKKIFKVFLLTTTLFVVANTTGLSTVKTAFAEEWSSSINMDTEISGPTLPSPGDTITVRVTLTNNDPDYRFYADGDIYAHIRAVSPDNSSYFTNPDPNGYLPAGTILNKKGLPGDSATITFSTGIKAGDSCTALYTQIKATPQYVGTAGGARNVNSYTTSGGIGANLYLAVYKADGTGAYGAQVRVNSGDWITLSASTYAYIFYNLNCDSQNFVEARSGTQYGSAYMSVNNTENADSYLNRFICNGQQRSLSIRMSLPPSPSPSPSSSPSPSPSSSASPSPSPSPPATGSVTLDPSCPGGTPTLSASWNLAAGTGYNVYLQKAATACQISTAQTGGPTTYTGIVTCGNGGTITIQDTNTFDLYGSNGITTVSDTVNTISCTGPPPSLPPSPPPPGEKPPPYFQTILEVANLTKGQTLPDDCGPNECQNQPSWPPACGRALRTTTQARLGDQIQVRICMRRMGGDSPNNRDTTNAVWLDQAFPGTINLAQGGRDFFSPDFMERGRESGTYTYHSFHGADSLRVPYNWYKWAGPDSCGDPNGNEWYYACVKALNMTFFIKEDDPNLLDKTLSTKSSLFISPYVRPYSDFHPYLTSCINVAQTGFWDRTPECCWGQPFYRNDIGGYPGCPIPQGDPRYNQCGYGPCDTGEKAEDFVFWSNWIRINVKTIAPWIQVTGDVHSNKRIRAPGGP